MLAMSPQHVSPCLLRGGAGRPGRPRARLALTALALLIGGALSGRAAPDLFDEIYARSLPIDATVKTIRASFVETTTSPMLAKPLVATGTLVAVRPTDVELIYRTPPEKTITIKNGQLILEMPSRKLRQERDISTTLARVQKYFVSKSPDELRTHFTIAASEDPARSDTYRIDMTPKRKQIEQGLTRLELWLRKDTLMLDAMRMHFPGDGTKLMEFKDVELNR